MKDVTFGVAQEMLEVRQEWMIIVRVECYSLSHPIRGSHSLLSSAFLCTNSGSISISITEKPFTSK